MACGVERKGSFNVKTSGSTFVLDKCPKGPATLPDTFRLVIDNKTGESFDLQLRGPLIYNFEIKPGINNVDVKPGQYSFRYFACERQGGGYINVKQDGTSKTLRKCPRRVNSRSGIVSVKIKNKTGGTLFMTLVGEETYNFTLPDGTSWIKVEAGRYAYTIFGCGGQAIKGYRRLGPRMEWGFQCTP
jgi:hypothetical protein